MTECLLEAKSVTKSYDDGRIQALRGVDVQMTRLRRKIELDPANPLFVQTVRGIGYRLMVSP